MTLETLRKTKRYMKSATYIGASGLARGLLISPS